MSYKSETPLNKSNYVSCHPDTQILKYYVDITHTHHIKEHKHFYSI